MGPLSYMRPVFDRKVVMRHMPVLSVQYQHSYSDLTFPLHVLGIHFYVTSVILLCCTKRFKPVSILDCKMSPLAGFLFNSDRFVIHES